MMKGFRIDRNDGRIYAMGMTAVSGGVHFSFPSRGETCAVILYRKGAKSPRGRIEFPVNARTGDVWSMTVLGDFSGLEYVYEVDGQQVPDPYGRKFTGMQRWGSLARLDRQVRTPVDTEAKAYDWEDDILTIFIPGDLPNMPPPVWKGTAGEPLRAWRRRFPISKTWGSPRWR